MSYDAVLVIAFGGPHRSEDVRPFLEDVLRGRPVPPGRIEEVAAHYELLGGRSPITEHTEAQARALQQALAERGHALPVRVGMRHWSPWLKEVIADLTAQGARRVLGVVMAAQDTEASVARYRVAVETARAEIGSGAPAVDYARGWGGGHGFVAANVARVRVALAQLPVEQRDDARLLCTAHSIPVSMAKGSPYVAQLEAITADVAAGVGLSQPRLVYQSRSGRPEDPWLEPDVVDELAAQARAGTRQVVVAPIGFVCDHVEVLYDLDHEARAAAERLGVGFVRAATVGDHPAFIAALADCVVAKLAQTS